MPQFSANLNLDDAGKHTSATYGDVGDGTDNWHYPTVTADGGNVALGATDDAAAPAGDGSAIALLKAIRDLTGALTPAAPSTSTVAPSNASSTVYASSLVIKASAGTLFGITGYSSRTTTQFIQLHDAASLPADTAAPKIVISVPPMSSFALDFGIYGRWFPSGIVICNSSTGPTKTIGSADCWFDAQYK